MRLNLCKVEVIKDTIDRIMQEWQEQRKRPAGDNPEVLLKKILTKKELGHVRFNYLRKGTLNINVDSSAWLYQLNLRRENLLAKLGKQSKTIKDIRFRLGETK